MNVQNDLRNSETRWPGLWKAITPVNNYKTLAKYTCGRVDISYEFKPWVYFISTVLLAPMYKKGRNPRRITAESGAQIAYIMTRFIRLWNSPQGESFSFRCPCKNLIRIQLIATNLSWLVYFASLMEDELRRKTDTICITMRSRANFKAGMKVARSSGKASSVFGPSLAKQR